MVLKIILAAASRRKTIESSFQSPLRRCLIFWDLLLLGVGGSVDIALYVMLGIVIRDMCGPSVMISMLLGFFVCFVSGLCYAEFASYVPTSGSDYDYVYSTLGELCGFLDGWSILSSSVIATSALAQGAADLLRSLTDSATFDHLDAHATLPHHELLASNINIVATIIITLVTVITAIGVQSSIRINNAIILINLLVIIFTFILGLVYIDFDHWSGWDNFAPYGVTGILKSLPYTIFFFAGFICVTFSTEEAKNPQKVMPQAIIASLIGIFICFYLVGFVLSLIVPHKKLSTVSPLSDAFAMVAFKQSKYIIAFGGFCSCFSSVFTASYGNSRLAYVMSRDGLIVNFLQVVNTRTLVPVRAVVFCGGIAALLAAFADLTILIEMCSILSVLPFVLLCIAVILLRYKVNDTDKTTDVTNDEEATACINSHDVIANNGQDEATKDELRDGHLSLSQTNVLCESKTKLRIKLALLTLVISSVGISLVARFGMSYRLGMPTFVTLEIVFAIPMLLSMMVIYRTPHQAVKFPFTMPMFPILPCICLALCIFVMVQFSMWSWILFVVHIAIGLIIYLSYGVKNSMVNSLRARTANIELTETETPELLT